MGLFQTLNERTREHGLPFLVIGGLAVNWYGYSRDTADLDLLVPLESRQTWLNLFPDLDIQNCQAPAPLSNSHHPLRENGQSI